MGRKTNKFVAAGMVAAALVAGWALPAQAVPLSVPGASATVDAENTSAVTNWQIGGNTHVSSLKFFVKIDGGPEIEVNNAGFSNLSFEDAFDNQSYSAWGLSPLTVEFTHTLESSSLNTDGIVTLNVSPTAPRQVITVEIYEKGILDGAYEQLGLEGLNPDILGKDGLVAYTVQGTASLLGDIPAAANIVTADNGTKTYTFGWTFELDSSDPTTSTFNLKVLRDVTISQEAIIPEPVTSGLAGLGLAAAGVAALRRRRA